MTSGVMETTWPGTAGAALVKASEEREKKKEGEQHASAARQKKEERERKNNVDEYVHGAEVDHGKHLGKVPDGRPVPPPIYTYNNNNGGAGLQGQDE